jgi:hypothetical protein
MGKVDDLKLKYSLVSAPTFNKFNQSDTTPTKKYLEYMLKIWTKDKHKITTTNVLIDNVKKFDELLPYIPLKDIYHYEYGDIDFLIAMVEKAEEIKEEKTFVREEHCDIIIDNDNFLFLVPKTQRGNLKYGANTRWCTVSRNDDSTFKRYTKSGLLGYIISKDEDMDENYKKVAIYCDYKKNSFSCEIDMWNTRDNKTNEDSMIKYGWNTKEVFDIVSSYRFLHHNLKKVVTAKDYVINFAYDLARLDFDRLEKSFNDLNYGGIGDMVSRLQESINKIQEKTLAICK